MSTVTNDLPVVTEPSTSKELSLLMDALVVSAAERLVDQAKATGVALTGEGGLLTDLQLEADAGSTEGVQQAYKELVHHLLDFDEKPSQETVALRAALRRRNLDQSSV